MSAVVFCGPTISADEARRRSGATPLGPAALGDVYRAVRDGASVVGLIDGYFERVPAVWHKEILWALGEGARVFGAASMGALRAAELDRFGMEGVGRAYAAFADGTLTDDDEVAVAHGDADDGYLAVSEAMIDIRATLEAAADAGVVTSDQHDTLVEAAKTPFYADRSWPSVLTALPVRDRGRVAGWIRSNRRRVKYEDALALCRRIADLGPADLVPDPTHDFVATTFWNHARRQVDGPRASDGTTVPTERVHDEVVLAGEPARRAHRQLRAERNGGATAPLATRHADAVDLLVDESGGRALVDRARHKHRTLERAGRLDADPAEVGLDGPDLQRWWYECVLDRAVPDDTVAAAARLDVGPVTFARILRRERCYRALLGHEVIDGVLGPADARELLDAVHRPGPVTRPVVGAPQPADTYYATIAGGSTVEAVAASIFRAPLTADSAEPLRWSRVLRRAVRRVAGPDAVIEPRHLLLNVMLPGQHVSPHVDVPEFRGLGRTEAPSWLLVAMGASGLFETFRAPTSTAVLFLGDGCGELELSLSSNDESLAIEPRHDRAVVFDADHVVHAVPALPGRPRADWTPMDRLRSVGRGRWVIDRGGDVVDHGSWHDVRLSVSWKARVFPTAEGARQWRSAPTITQHQAESTLTQALVDAGRLDAGAGRDEAARAAIDHWVASPTHTRS